MNNNVCYSLSIKVIVVIITVILLASAFVLLWISEYQATEAEIVESARGKVDYAFFHNGATYLLAKGYKNNENTTVLFKENNKDFCLRLPGENTSWAPAIERFIYTDGQSLKICDINGENHKLLLELKAADKLEFELIDNYACIRSIYDSYGSTVAEGFYKLVDLNAGEVVDTEMNASSPVRGGYIDNGWLYYKYSNIYSSDTETYDIFELRRCNLKSGKCEMVSELGRIAPHDICINGDYVYFSNTYNNINRIYRVSKDSGKPEMLDIDFWAMGLRSGIGPLLVYNNKLFTIYRNGSTYDFYAISPDVPAVKYCGSLGDWDENFSLNNLLLSDDILILCSRDGKVETMDISQLDMVD